jgi:hypothetical protein
MVAKVWGSLAGLHIWFFPISLALDLGESVLLYPLPSGGALPRQRREAAALQ